MYNTLMQPDQNDEQQPVPASGFVFHPDDTLKVDHKPEPAIPQATPTIEQPRPETPPQSPSVPQSPVQPVTPQPQPTSWQQTAPDPDDDSQVSWTASEFIAHQKGFEWYLGLGLGAILLAALVYIFTRDYVSSGMIVIVALAFGIFAVKKPRVLQYTLDDDGMTIGQKHYAFSMFKSFSVIDDGAAHALLLMPMQRFMPSISVYYAPDDEEKILTKIADFLPFEEHSQDVVDRVMRRIRF